MSEPRMISIVDRQSGCAIDMEVTDEDRARPFPQFVTSHLEPAFTKLFHEIFSEPKPAGFVAIHSPNLSGATYAPHIVLTGDQIAEFFGKFRTPPPVPLDQIRALHGILDPDEPWSRSWYIEPPYQPEEPDVKAR